MQKQPWVVRGWRAGAFFGLFVAGALGHARTARAEFCWEYVKQPSDAPIDCVREGDASLQCGWFLQPAPGNLCHVEDNLSPLTQLEDCCTTAPAVTTQSIELRHSLWHQCFGPTGNSGFLSAAHAATGRLNPPGRGSAWYAMHRQILIDFDIFRDLIGADRIEWVPQFAGRPLFHEYPSGVSSVDGQPICAANGDAVWRRGAETGPNDGPPCQDCITYPDCLNHRPNDQPSSGTCSAQSIKFVKATDGRVAICGPVSGGSAECHFFDDGSLAPDSLPELTSIDQFTNVEQVTDLMDAYLHGQMHGAVASAGSRDANDPSGQKGLCSVPPYASCSTDADCAATNVGPCNLAGPPPALGSCARRSDLKCNTDADCGVCMSASSGHAYCRDINNPSNSVRDPEFWRLHKSLDVAVQAWQRTQAADIMIVLDRSGSMNEQDSSSARKFSKAVEAAMMLIGMLPDETAGIPNRVGITLYSTSTTPLRPLTPVATLKADATLENDLNGVQPSGCTSIGGGLTAATGVLCPTAGGCADHADKRRAIVLLTDGIENVSPCLFNDGSTGQCGSTCNGTAAETTALYRSLGDTQVCAVGFGATDSVSGDRLTLLAERQGGIYRHSPATDPADGTYADLKVAFAKCLGMATAAAIALDPEGTLEAGRFASEPATTSVCVESRLSLSAGWKKSVAPGNIRLMLNAPSGALVRANAPGVESGLAKSWGLLRTPLPFAGEQQGEWRAQLIRPHKSYVNGFTTDSLATSASVPLVRREIQRICPDGCATALYFEDGHNGPDSSYELALAAEGPSGTGLIGTVVATTDPNNPGVMSPDVFKQKLETEQFDLIVYAHQMSQSAEVFDTALGNVICGQQTNVLSQRAIVTDTRTSLQAAAQINACAGAILDGPPINFTEITGDGRLLEGTHHLTNPGTVGYTFSYGAEKIFAQSEFPGETQATSSADGTPAVSKGAISAMTPLTTDESVQKWFMDLYVDTSGLLESHKTTFAHRTGQGLTPSVQILPGFVPAGGYDSVDATVTIERPTVGIGSLLIQQGMPAVSFGAESYGGRAGGLQTATIPTELVGPFTLNDDGVDGDIHPGNFYWTKHVADQGQVDGMYRYTFHLKLTKNGCTTERELAQTVFVDVGTDPASTTVSVQSTPTGSTVTVFPKDPFGNPWGPGRTGAVSCGPPGQYTCDPSQIVDNGDGTYTIVITSLPGANGPAQVTGFGTTISVPIQGGGVWPMFHFSRDRRGLTTQAGPQTANVLWKFAAGALGIDSSPAVGSDGTIYFGAHDNNVYAVKPDGSLRWKTPTSGLIHSSPAIGQDGTVYIGSDDDKLRALNGQTGAVLWATNLGSRDVQSSPAIAADGTIYVGGNSGRLYALDPSGSIRWSFSAGAEVESSPAVAADGTVFVGSENDNVYAITPAGVQKWRFKTGLNVHSTPAVSNDGTAIYVGSDDAKVYKLNAATGAKIWSFNAVLPVRSSPAVADDGTVVVGSDANKVWALNPDTGVPRWTFTTGGNVKSSAAIGTGGFVYVGSDDDRIYCLRLSDGTSVWSFKTNGDVQSSPAIGPGGRLYVASNDNNLRAFGPSNPAFPLLTVAPNELETEGGAPGSSSGCSAAVAQLPTRTTSWLTGGALLALAAYRRGRKRPVRRQ